MSSMALLNECLATLKPKARISTYESGGRFGAYLEFNDLPDLVEVSFDGSESDDPKEFLALVERRIDDLYNFSAAATS